MNAAPIFPSKGKSCGSSRIGGLCEIHPLLLKMPRLRSWGFTQVALSSASILTRCTSYPSRRFSSVLSYVPWLELTMLHARMMTRSSLRTFLAHLSGY